MMHVKHTASAFAIAAIAALTLAACGGDDGSAPGPNPGPGPSPTPPAGLVPEKIEFDVVEELLRPNATVPLEVELETAGGRDVPASGADNVKVEIVSDGTGGAKLNAAQLSTNREGEARFSITLGRNTGTVILKATTDGADNNVTNGISNELSVLLGMVVTDRGDGLNWELPPVVEIGSGGTVRLEDADDGQGWRSYSVNSADLTLNPCGDDVCLGAPAGMRAGTYDLTFTVTDTASSTLDIPVQVVVR